MLPRRSLKWPILLAVAMIALLAVLAVSWVLSAVFGALGDRSYAPLHWTLLSIGATFIVLLLAGTIVYLVLSIKAINLTRRQSNFIDSVTHELKSPISSMKLYLQTLSRRQVSEAERAEFYRVMLEDVERLDRLINQVLDAGRLESVDGDAAIEDVDLPQLLQQCAETVCTSYHLPLEVIRFDLQPCCVRARPADLMLIFRNLLDNAVKYAGTAPEVAVAAELSGSGTVVVRIADNGRGIPPRFRNQVFGRFVRLGTELERDKPGTGLGLHIAHTLVRRWRGRIRIRGREPGPGTVFEVELPVVSGPAAGNVCRRNA
jgi:two-component system, OmpR family, phosphate regulon sensor histidine kinase PhoR